MSSCDVGVYTTKLHLHLLPHCSSFFAFNTFIPLPRGQIWTDSKHTQEKLRTLKKRLRSSGKCRIGLACIGFITTEPQVYKYETCSLCAASYHQNSKRKLKSWHLLWQSWQQTHNMSIRMWWVTTSKEIHILSALVNVNPCPCGAKRSLQWDTNIYIQYTSTLHLIRLLLGLFVTPDLVCIV